MSLGVGFESLKSLVYLSSLSPSLLPSFFLLPHPTPVSPQRPGPAAVPAAMVLTLWSYRHFLV